MDAILTLLKAIDLRSYILLISVAAAFYAVHRNQIINRRRATVDLVLHQRSDADLKAANAIVNPLLKTNNITKYASNENKDSEEAKAILEVINNYEFIAAGIREGAFDYLLFQRMKHGVVVRDWDSFKAYIYDFRESRNHKTLFQEFEWLAKKFKHKPLKTNNKDQ